MIRYCPLLVLCVLAASPPLAAISIPVTTSGTFTYDTDKYTVDFTLSQNSTVTIRTMGYGGGTAYNGTVYAGGGFESVISIFEKTSGNLVNVAQAGLFDGCVLDAGVCGDVFHQQALMAGTYTVVLTQWDNIPYGTTLGEGFLYENLYGSNYNYTSGGGLPFLARDWVTQRTGEYALEITRSAYPTVVPEPTTYFGLAGMALVGLRLWRRKRKDSER